MPKAARFVLTCLIGLLATTSAAGQQALRIGNVELQGLLPTDLPVTLDSVAPTEGFVIAIAYDSVSMSVTGIDLDPAVAAALAPDSAELVAGEIFDAQGGCTLGVVFDATAPFNGQALPAGLNQPIAVLQVIADLVPAMPPEVLDITFVDGTLNSPPLSNILVQGGLSLGAGAVDLIDGTVTLMGGGGPDTLTIVGGDINTVLGPGCAEIRMTNVNGEVQGFVLSIQHDPDLDLDDINIAGSITETVGAEFVVPDIQNSANGGTLGVVLDFSAPFDGQVIPVGADQLIATFCYSCDEIPVDPEPASSHPLTFVDGVFGSPPLENVIVMAGISLNPQLTNGTMTCLPVTDGANVEFVCGVKDEFGNIVDPVGSPEETIEICFFYISPTEAVSGFQLAVAFDCCLEFIEGTFDVGGTLLDEVGAEFVNHNVDNDPHDGDGCEFVAGILLDALPPFDGQTVPPTSVPLKIGSIDIFITDTCECNTCYSVAFQDGVNGRGMVPIENVVIVDTVVSLQGFPKQACNVCVEAEREFIRGDCNFDEKVNLADAAGSIAAQFQGYMPPCEDACDANDDGKINLADAVFVMNYQFKFGPEPPAPFPDQGSDETIDDPTGLHVELGCESGRDPCPN